MPFQTAKGKIIYEPCYRDNDTIYDLFTLLKENQSVEGLTIYDQVLKIYLLNRTAWELEGTGRP